MSDQAQSANQSKIPLQEQVADLQRRLALSEEREQILSQLLNNIPSAIYATYADGRIAFVNIGFAAQWGKTPADFQGHTLADLFPPETAAAWQQNVEDTIRSDCSASSHESYGDGAAARHYDSLRFPIHNAEGKGFALGGVATDVTERIQAEIKFVDTQRILNGIVNNSPAVIYVKDTNNRLMLINQTYADVLGQSITDLVGRTEDELFPAALVAQWRESDRMLFATRQSLRFANSFSVKGEQREFITNQFPLYDEEGKPYAMCGISTDVTDLKHAEREREQLQQEIILAQQAALRELNTPLIPLADDVVVMPLVGSIDSARATQVMETLLEGVSIHNARLAIIDITGLPVVDSQVANALLQAAQAVKLLGAEVLLTGIGPEVAQTLVGIGADLSGLRTPGTLQAGINYALRGKKQVL